MKKFILLFWLFYTIPGLAQDSSKFDASFSVGGFIMSGNTDKIYSNFKSDFKYLNNWVESDLNLNFGYGESKGKKDDNNMYSTFAADFFHPKRISPFIFQTLVYDYKRDISIRSQSGLGLRYLIIKNSEHKTSLSMAIINDYTEFSYRDSNITRLSLRFKTVQLLYKDQIRLSNITFYQPSLSNFKDVIWRSETVLDTKISSVFKFFISYLYTQEAIVSDNKETVDRKLIFGITINL